MENNPSAPDFLYDHSLITRRQFLAIAGSFAIVAVRRIDEFDEIIANHKLNERLTLLRGRFGDALNPFLEGSGIAESFRLHQISDAWRPLASSEKRARGDQPVTIEGFEQFGNVSNADVLTFLHTLPLPWAAGSTERITFKTRSAASTIKQIYRPQLGRAFPGYDNKRGYIEIWKNMAFTTLKTDSRKVLFTTLLHELGHQNDWEQCRLLAHQERIIFLNEASDLWFLLRGKKAGGQDGYDRMSEWWADICAGCLGSERDSYRGRNPKETALFDRWFKTITGGA